MAFERSSSADDAADIFMEGIQKYDCEIYEECAMKNKFIIMYKNK